MGLAQPGHRRREGGPASAEAAAAAPSATGWQLIYRSHFPTPTVLDGLAVTGPRAAWAVGYTYAGGFVLHWNGTNWRAMAGFPGHLLPTAVAASSGDNVWVIAGVSGGGPGQYEAAGWNGHAWRVVPMPDADGGAGTAATTSVTNLWVSNGQRLAHWDGSRWTSAATASPVVLAAVPGGEVWSASKGKVGGHGSRLVVRQWTGHGWQWVHVPHPVVRHVSPYISIESRTNIAIETTPPSGSSGQLVIWNGRDWHTLTVPWWAAGPLTATGRDSAWAGPAALWNGHTWVHGNPDTAGLGMAGVPGTSATLLYSYGRPSAKSQQIAGSIWLNGRL